MTTEEVAAAFAALLRQGRDAEAPARFWSDDVAGFEPMDGPMSALCGRNAVLGKHAWWTENFEVHGAEVEGPWTHGDAFALRLAIDATERATGTRAASTEIGLYAVRDGKVVEERFFGDQPPAA